MLFVKSVLPTNFPRFSLPTDPPMPGNNSQAVGGDRKDCFRSPSGRRGTRGGGIGGGGGRYTATFTNDEEVSVFEDAKSELDEIKVRGLRSTLDCFKKEINDGGI